MNAERAAKRSQRAFCQAEKEETMQRTSVFLATVTLLTILVAPAASADNGWHLRVFAAGFDPDLDETVPAENPEFVDVTGDSDLGFGLSLEYQFAKRWGVEAGFMKASPAVEISGEIPGYGELVLTDPMAITALTLEINLHLLPNNKLFDVYLGAGMARMSYEDLSYEIEEADDTLAVRVNNDTAWSVKAGVDIALGGSGWSAIGGLRYLDSALEVSNTDDAAEDTVTFDYPIVNFFVGVGYSF
jgi:opacity protein-like surface antigen